MLKIFYIFTLFIIIASCQKTFVVIPEYDGELIKNSSIFVKVCNPPIINVSKDAFYFRGKGSSEKHYKSILFGELSISIRNAATFNKIYIDTSINSSHYKEITKPLSSEEEIKLMIPEDIKSLLKNKNLKYSLFIQNLKIYPEEEWILTDPLRYNQDIIHDGKYVIWDNEMNRMVSYGIFNSETAFLGKVNRRTWTKSIFNLIYTIFERTPFRRLRGE